MRDFCMWRERERERESERAAAGIWDRERENGGASGYSAPLLNVPGPWSFCVCVWVLSFLSFAVAHRCSSFASPQVSSLSSLPHYHPPPPPPPPPPSSTVDRFSSSLFFLVLFSPLHFGRNPKNKLPVYYAGFKSYSIEDIGSIWVGYYNITLYTALQHYTNVRRRSFRSWLRFECLLESRSSLLLFILLRRSRRWWDTRSHPTTTTMTTTFNSRTDASLALDLIAHIRSIKQWSRHALIQLIFNY